MIESRLDGKIHDDTHEVVNLLIAVRECGRKNLRSQADEWIEELEKRRHRRKVVDHQYAEYENESNDDDVEDSPKPRKRHSSNNIKENVKDNNHNRRRSDNRSNNWNNKHISGIKIRIKELEESNSEIAQYKIIEILPKNVLNNIDNKSQHSLRSRRNRRKYNDDGLEVEEDDKDDEDYK